MSFTQRPQSLRATFNVDKYNCIYKVEAQRDLLNTQRELACDHIKCILSLRWPAAVEHLYRLHKPGTFYYFLRLYIFYIFFLHTLRTNYNTHTEFITLSLILRYKGSQRKTVSNLVVLCQGPVQFSWLDCSGNYLGLCYRNLELPSSFFKNTLKWSTYGQQLVPNVTASFNEESLQQPAEPISGITTSSFTEANAMLLRYMSVHH